MPKLGFKMSLVFVMGLLLIATLLLYPFETTVVPEWRIHVSDQNGKSMRGIPIREVWSNYLIESHDHEEDLLTDADGYITFPRRTIKANFLVRIVKTTINKLNVHGGSGPTAYLLVIGDYSAATDEPYYVPGRSLATQIVVRPPGASAP